MDFIQNNQEFKQRKISAECNSLATASFILGVIGIATCFFFVGSVMGSSGDYTRNYVSCGKLKFTGED